MRIQDSLGCQRVRNHVAQGSEVLLVVLPAQLTGLYDCYSAWGIYVQNLHPSNFLKRSHRQ